VTHTILVVDDETRIVKLVRDYLERAGFAVLSARDGETAVLLARRERPDLIILDLMLPGVDGLDVCRRLRQESAVPYHHAHGPCGGGRPDRGPGAGRRRLCHQAVQPSRAGARVRAALRRASGQIGPASVIRCGDLQLDTVTMTATVGASRWTGPHRVSAAGDAGPPAGRIFGREQLLEAIHEWP